MAIIRHTHPEGEQKAKIHQSDQQGHPPIPPPPRAESITTPCKNIYNGSENLEGLCYL
jgi:hypothetical protein